MRIFPSALEEISTHAPRTGSDMPRCPYCDDEIFQPTLPARGATRAACTAAADRRISTHAPRTGSDANGCSPSGTTVKFQPTLPARGATMQKLIYKLGGDISTHAPRTGSDTIVQTLVISLDISTHAPRTGSDRLEGLHGVHAPSISTHAPRTGSDGDAANRADQPAQFQPTLPARGATRRFRPVCSHRRHFNPRSPHGERHDGESRDRRQQHFNPRSPHGERLPYSVHFTPFHSFQPTLPARGATSPEPYTVMTGSAFQPTLPARGATRTVLRARQQPCHFNPRSPHGERPSQICNENCTITISTHAPRTGSDPLGEAG